MIIRFLLIGFSLYGIASQVKASRGKYVVQNEGTRDSFSSDNGREYQRVIDGTSQKSKTAKRLKSRPKQKDFSYEEETCLDLNLDPALMLDPSHPMNVPWNISSFRYNIKSNYSNMAGPSSSAQHETNHSTEYFKSGSQYSQDEVDDEYANFFAGSLLDDTHNQYYTSYSQNNENVEDEETARSFADSLLVCPYEQEEEENAEKKDATHEQRVTNIQTENNPDQERHKFVRMSKKRGSCKQHNTNFGYRARVFTGCETCNETLCRECYKIKHELPDPPPKPTRKSSSFDPVQKCAYCNEILDDDLEKLIDHTLNCRVIPRAVDSRLSKYFCYKDKCEYQTIDRNSMRSHLRKASHTGIQPFKCEQCGQRFSLKKNRDRHKWTMHI